MREEPERFDRLSENARSMHSGLIDACRGTGFTVQAVDISPLKHLTYVNADPTVVEQKLDAFVNEACFCYFSSCFSQGNAPGLEWNFLQLLGRHKWVKLLLYNRARMVLCQVFAKLGLYNLRNLFWAIFSFLTTESLSLGHVIWATKRLLSRCRRKCHLRMF